MIEDLLFFVVIIRANFIKSNYIDSHGLASLGVVITSVDEIIIIIVVVVAED